MNEENKPTFEDPKEYNKTWNAFELRIHAEQVLNQRYNFFVVTYALFITASVVSSNCVGINNSATRYNNEILSIIIMAFGIIILIPMWLTLYRAYKLTEMFMKYLYDVANEIGNRENKKCNYNYFLVRDELTKEIFLNRYSSLPLIGVVIPSLCILSLAVLLLYLCFPYLCTIILSICVLIFVGIWYCHLFQTCWKKS